MAFAECPDCDRLATAPRDAVLPPPRHESEPLNGVLDTPLLTVSPETHPGDTRAAPSPAAEAIMRLEQEVCDLWGYSLEAANRPFAERLVEVGRALRRAARSLDNDQDA
ncbi:MAG: hypothetical protein ABJD24_04800 [Acidimicrobiales bacterium]